MRYQLDTIPVWDAYKEKGGHECPLCVLRAENESMYLESFLGASVMEPATRVEVNAKGFCARHFAQMLPRNNRLGLALITHTHLKDVMSDVQKALRDGERSTSAGRGLFRRGGNGDSSGSRLRARLESCVVCERLDATLRRYAYTLIHLWKTDAEFRQAFAESKGLCLPDMALLMEMVDEELSGKQRQDFYAALEAVQEVNLARIERELEWFTLKFDYRNQDKPWGSSADAPERAIGKLRGF